MKWKIIFALGIVILVVGLVVVRPEIDKSNGVITTRYGDLNVFFLGDIEENGEPEQEVIWKDNCQVRCVDEKCNTILGQTIWVNDSDGTCKEIEKAKSLKNAWNVIYLSKSNHFNITLIDYNYTHIKGNLTASKDLEEEELEFEVYATECNETDCWEASKYKWKFKWKEGETETEFEFDTMDLWGVSPSALTYHFDPKEYWGTTNAVHNIDGDVTSLVNSNDGSGSDLYGKNNEYIDFISWNDSMPVGYMINKINFTVDVQNVGNTWGLAIQHNKTGSYVTECSWADVDALNPLVCEFNISGEPNPWWTQDVNDLGIRLLSSGLHSGEVDYGEMYVYYAQPTTIQLQDADTENLGDVHIREYEPTNNFGALEFLTFQASNAQNYDYHILFKFNISSIPSGNVINNATLFLYMSLEQIDTGEEYYVDTHHIYSYPIYSVNDTEWIEGSGITSTPCTTGEVCWFVQPIGEEFNSTRESRRTITGSDPTPDAPSWWNWSVTNMVSTEYLEEDKSISIFLKSVYSSGDPTDDDFVRFHSKEYTTNTTLRPYLNITYSLAETIPPTYSDNSTNSTLAGEDVLHSLKWVDTDGGVGGAGLSGYIFQFCNGTWNGTYCKGTSENWANSSFDRCKDITITNGGVTTLTNFPAYINLTKDNDMLSDYSDLRFYDSSCNNGGSLMDYEIENYTSTNAHTWVKIPSLPSAGKTISVYYKNNTNINSGENPAGVWDNYRGVYHFDERTGDALDSSPKYYNATTTSVNSQTATGIVGNCFEWNALEHQVDIPLNVFTGDDGATGLTEFTLEMWHNADASGEQPLYGLEIEAGGHWELSHGAVTGGDGFRLRPADASENECCDTDVVYGNVPTTWQYLTLKWKAGENLVIYKDGVVLSNVSIASGTPTHIQDSDSTEAPTVNSIGWSQDDAGFDGLIDEVRISSVSRSDDWIKQSYLLVVSQDTYVVFGTEENKSLWVSDSFVPMTGILNWSNVTKTINSTVGVNIAWCVETNDTADNWNSTSCVTPFSYVTTAPLEDTCSCPASGNWLIQCSDNCDIQACDMQTNNVLLNGTGNILSLRNVTNATRIRMQQGCVVRW